MSEKRRYVILVTDKTAGGQRASVGVSAYAEAKDHFLQADGEGVHPEEVL